MSAMMTAEAASQERIALIEDCNFVGLSNILDNELNGGKPMEGFHR